MTTDAATKFLRNFVGVVVTVDRWLPAHSE